MLIYYKYKIFKNVFFTSLWRNVKVQLESDKVIIVKESTVRILKTFKEQWSRVL